jgi:uridylate kinase
MNIIKYGGSRVSPSAGEHDDAFIDSLIGLVNNYKDQDFMVVIGGGALARHKQAQEPSADSDRKDWLGIEATWENAAYVIDRFVSSGVEGVYGEVIKDPHEKVEGHRVYFAGGYKPGNSTDFVTMLLAKNYGASRVVKVSNFDVVKDISPIKFFKVPEDERGDVLARAADLNNATWKEMRDLVGEVWVPGLNTPLDPRACGVGLENPQIALYICRESQIRNVLDDDLNSYVGTIIKN